MDLKRILPPEYPSNKGFYIMPNGSTVGFPTFTMLSRTFDTVRQFFDCLIKPSLLKDCETRFSGGVDVIGSDLNGEGGIEYVFLKLGKASGYQYSLQSKKYGIQALFKRSHQKSTSDESQVKLELSPSFLVLPYDEQKKHVSIILNHIAQQRLGKADYLPVHYAIHYALDFQLPNESVEFVDDVFPDFAKNLVGFRGSRGYENKSLSFEVKDFNAMINGVRGAETITLGSPNAMQISIYRKDLEIVKTKKIEHFNDVWGDKYNKDLPVFRLELRLHQDQLKPYKHKTGSFYLDYIKSDNWAIMRKFLIERARYMDDTKTVLHPIWLEILNHISEPEFIERENPKKDPLKVDKNLSHILGNSASMLFKAGLDGQQAYNQLVAMLDTPIFFAAFANKWGLLHDDPDLIFKLKDKLYEYAVQKYEKFKLEYLI